MPSRDVNPETSLPDASRVAWVDAAKGIGIVLVVTMHATLGVGEAMGGEGFLHQAVAFAKPFRMPDFFLVAGLFLARVIDRDWASYLDKRVLHFAYFYLLWLVIQSGLKAGQIAGPGQPGFAAHLATALVEPYATLWFIYMLAVFSVATKALRLVPPPVLLAVAAALQVASVQTGWTLVDEFCERWIYFLIGYLLAERIFALAAAVVERPRLAVLGLTAWALANGAFAFTETGLDGFPTLASLPGASLVLGLAGALAIVATSALITPHAAAAPLLYAGRHSLVIYLAFFLPMAATRILLVRLGWIEDVGVVSCLVTAAALVIPLLMERLTRNTALSLLFQRPAWLRLGRARRAARPHWAG